MNLSESYKKRLLELSGLNFEANEPTTSANPKIEVVKVSGDDQHILMDICNKTLLLPGFEMVCTRDPRQRIQTLYQPEISYKALVDNVPVGFYFLSDKESMIDFIKWVQKAVVQAPGQISITAFNEELYKNLENKRGVQGVALGVLQEHQGKGIGKMLMDVPSNLGYDYIWGTQTEHISNVSKWLSRRVPIMNFVFNGLHCTITVQQF